MFSKFFFTLTSIFLLFGLITSASPIDLIKRQTSTDQLTTIVTGLQDTIYSYNSSFTSTSSVTDAETALTAINTAITQAVSDINALPPATKRELSSRQLVGLNGLGTVLGNVIQTLIIDVEGILVELEATPLLGTLIADIDPGLNEILNAVEALLQGVLTTVAELLNGVSGLLVSLAAEFPIVFTTISGAL